MQLRTAVLITVLACTSVSADKTALTAEQRRVNLESFDYVWNTVRDKHWDPRLGGLDWQAVRDELRPKVENATTQDQARDAMSEMLKRLHQTHFGIIPSEVYGEMKGGKDDHDAADNGEGGPGIDLRVLDGHAVVTDVTPDSPAANAGIKPGWEIAKVDGKDIAKSLTLIEEKSPDTTLRDLRLMHAVEDRLGGDVGSRVEVEFRDSTDRRVTLKLDRISPRGSVAHLGNLPPLHFWVETRKLETGIGYLRFNMFFEPDALMTAVSRIMKECTGCRGFIVDLRGNPGGIGGLAMGLAGWFTDKSGTRLGTMYMRSGNLNFAIFARPEPFRGPLAILVDGCSASTSEIFAGGLKDLGRARIFGTRTAGAALPSMIERLPNGDGFQYAFANYISEGGKALEGSGVIPDEEVKLTRRALLDGKDPVIERAAAWIETGKK
jgi:carboxyl-terminal processing protease